MFEIESVGDRGGIGGSLRRRVTLEMTKYRRGLAVAEIE